jgi:Protein of unknown function (DUF1761)
MLVEVNIWAVLIAAIVSFAVGSAWYSPLLFVKPWMKLRGLDPLTTNKMQMPYGNMAVEFVTTLVTAYFIAEFAMWVGADSLVGGLVLGFWIWLGFYATTLVGPVLWEKVPVKLYAISAGRWLVSLLVMAAIIGVWR